MADITTILVAAGVFIISAIVTYLAVSNRAQKKLGEYKSFNEAIDNSKEKLTSVENDWSVAKQKLTNVENDLSVAKQKLTSVENDLAEAKEQFVQVDNETKELQKLKAKANQLQEFVIKKSKQLKDTLSDIESKKGEIESLDKQQQQIMSNIDLYSRLEEFVEYGLFEMPDYLYETSARFAEEIKRIREKQRDLIKNKVAITYPDSITITANKRRDKLIFDGQIRLMLTAFNVDCDLLIGKVNPGNFPRTLERIEKLAAALEKSAATLHCGFNIEYVKLKYEECKIQYQFKLKKQEEQEEQRLIREQMREEQKAIREYERAIAQAEEEERIYRDMLEKAREQLKMASEEERAMAEQRIADLENLLAVAEAKEQRAKSMAEQTRRGHVYVISNIGSFGENIYKIGLTRRLEPELRVKELGDASVPFAFDVHAMIYSEDAPAIEAALHREFKRRHVNAVNFRKEFFRVDLQSIKDAVEKITGGEAEFKMTALAEEYYESRRLQSVEVSTP